MAGILEAIRLFSAPNLTSLLTIVETLHMAYPRDCIYCGQPILMSEMDSGNWQPWELDGSARHKCGSGKSGVAFFPIRASEPETRPSSCPWCKKPVYYHSNGHGDSVYFDALGIPWKIHPCWVKYWKTKVSGRILIKQRQQVLLQEARKHRKLRSAIDRIKRSESNLLNTDCFEKVETRLANLLHLNPKQFRYEYGHLYTVEPQAIRFVDLLPSLERLAQSSEEAVKPEETPKLKSSKKKKKKKEKVVIEREEMVTCSYCRNAVRQSLLNLHLVNAHKINIPANSSLLNKQSFQREVGCPYCYHVIFEDRLKMHIQVFHQKKSKRNKEKLRPLDVCLSCRRGVDNLEKHLREKHPGDN